MAEYTQDHRRTRITTPLGEDVLLLTSFEGEEEISRLFSLKVTMMSMETSIKPADIVGQNVTIELYDSDDEACYFNGHVRSFSNQGSGDRGTIYSAQIVPALWFLTRRKDSRIFQEMSVVDILKKVFDEAGMSDYDVAGISGSYSTLEYCVQYEETDFEFVSRLMEEYGIFYFFKHEDGKHTLMLADASRAYPTAKHDRVRFAGSLAFDEVGDDLTAWIHEYAFRSGKVMLSDFDFIKPENAVESREKTLVKLPKNDKYEQFSYPGGFTERAEGDKLARVRMEAEEVDHDRVMGAGKLRSFSPGYTFTIDDHQNEDEVGKSYVLLRVQHSIAAGSYVSGGDQPEGYENQFVCIPSNVTYRPDRRTPKSIVKGPQTATVVGPAGEEIYTDKHGRVKVQFHWDRQGKKDDKSSCWVRVSQVWAGKGWGAMHIPRIDQEVIVEFLEGDPDKPIITGRVYNGANTVPWELPANATQSGIKSNSSKGGGGFNEFRFEDKKGAEQVFMHAQKNRDSRILNDDHEWIGNDQHQIVKNDQFETIEGERHTLVKKEDFLEIKKDSHITIGGAESKEVKEDQGVTVKGDVVEVYKGSQSTEIGMDLFIKAMGTVIESTKGITLKCGGNSIVLDPSGVTIKGSQVVVDGKMVRIASGPGSPPTAGKAGKAEKPKKPKDPKEAATP